MEVGALEELESKKDGAACSVRVIVCVSICAEEEQYEGWAAGLSKPHLTRCQEDRPTTVLT